MKKTMMAFVFCGMMMPALSFAQTDADPVNEQDAASFIQGTGENDTPQQRRERALAVAKKTKEFQRALEQFKKAEEAARIEADKMDDSPEQMEKYRKSLLELQLRQKLLEEEARMEMERANGGEAQ